jgi:hypothetical protein
MIKGIRNITRKDLGTTYHKSMVCEDMTFFVNAEECDDNGNVCAFYNDGNLASSNIFANHEFFQRLYLGHYEWISEEVIENLKLMLEADGEEISDCAELYIDPIERDLLEEDVYTVYVSPNEDSFIAVSQLNDAIVTYPFTDSVEDLLKMEKTIEIVDVEFESNETPEVRDLFFTSAFEYACKKGIAFDIKNQKLIELED